MPTQIELINGKTFEVDADFDQVHDQLVADWGSLTQFRHTNGSMVSVNTTAVARASVSVKPEMPRPDYR